MVYIQGASITLFRSITSSMGLTVLCGIFFTFSMDDGIFHIILSVPCNTIMYPNNVMIS